MDKKGVQLEKWFKHQGYRVECKRWFGEDANSNADGKDVLPEGIMNSCYDFIGKMLARGADLCGRCGTCEFSNFKEISTISKDLFFKKDI